MNIGKFLKAALAVSVVAAVACGLAGCADSAKPSSGVAATVNGVEIPEEKVTDYIQTIRSQYGLEEEDAWGEYLASSNMTPESLREDVINSLVDKELVKEGASKLGITIEESEIDTYVDSMRANFDDDEAWNTALEQAGMTAESYRESIRESLTEQAINKHFEDEAKVEDSDILEAAKTYAPYYDGSKRSSHILIGVENKDDEKAMKEAREKAQDIVDRINAGEISFEDAVKEYSTDKGSAENGGDVGWDRLNSFVTEYTEALEGLDKGEMSGPVDSQFGVHIIKVTDVYKAPEEVKSVKDLPKEFRSSVEEYAKSTKSNSDYTAWLEEQRKAADIQINDMPADVPYNVDMTKYQQESSEAAEGEEGEAAEGESDGAQEVQVETEAAGSEESEDVEVIDVEASGESADAESAGASEGAESASAESASAEAESASAESASASAESASAESAGSEGTSE